jgi:hypothetical protein
VNTTPRSLCARGVLIFAQSFLIYLYVVANAATAAAAAAAAKISGQWLQNAFVPPN